MKTEEKVRLGLLAAVVAVVGGWAWLSPSGKEGQSSASASSNPAAEGEVIDFKFLDRALIQPETEAKVSYPAEMSALDNQRVSIVGFMAPFEEIDNMQRFMLLPSYVGCYFCSPPSFTQVVLVEQKNKGGGKLPFINDPIMVSGTLRLYSKGSQHPAHKAEFVYALDDADVRAYSGANVPSRASGHQPTRKPLLGDPLAKNTTNPAQPAQGAATPHKAFQPQFLVPSVVEIRKLPMMREIKFSGVPFAEAERLVTERINAQHSAAEWKARERAFIALGFADGPFDLPRMMAGLELRRTAGCYDAKADTVYYDKDLQFSQPEARMQMVKLIDEALVAQNVSLEAFLKTSDDDSERAARALQLGDPEQLARMYDQRTRLLGGSAPALAPLPAGFAAPPPALQRLYDLVYNGGDAFVAQAFPPEQRDKLNAAYDNPPRAMAQILHPDFYLNPSIWNPLPVAWPDEQLQGAKPVYSGVLGEAGLVAWMSRLGGSTAHEANGWRGDRYAVWDGGKEGDSWLLETHWADKYSAGDFFAAARSMADPQHTLSLTDEGQTDAAFATHISGRPYRVLYNQDHTRVYVLKAAFDAQADAMLQQFAKG